ncbi:ATP-binding protein [Chloroflexus aggregans]|uniref:histidine kinase n=1 Tax=Chloroflexus aggregans (strain MD-66 / DSM 9485) TaxID=326427 RepID=B8GA64_CHLAD|nr:ATP-binding protein [Chloroflexus aggregans]ACL24579.1 multi-sensor signal transduction histidine kinase [Chloroflexus aggregans DSM 9485]
MTEPQRELSVGEQVNMRVIPAERVRRWMRASAAWLSLQEPERLFPALTQSFIEVLPEIRAAILWLVRASSLQPVAQAGLTMPAALTEQWLKIKLRPGEGVAGLAWQRETTVQQHGEHGYRELQGLAPPHVQAIFQAMSDLLPRSLTVTATPLRAGHVLVGVLELIGCDAKALDVEPDDLDMIASIVAAAIRNAQLYDEIRRSNQRLKAFDAVVTSISTAADLPDLVQSVLTVVLELTPARSGALLIFDPAQECLQLSAWRNLDRAVLSSFDQVPVDTSPCAEVVRYGQPAFRPLLIERGEEALLAAGMVEAAYLPLLAGGTVTGVLALFGEVNLNRSLDKDMLMPICNQVGFAIANVRLYEDSQRERRKLHTVVESIAEGVLLCDRHGRLTLANQAAQELLDEAVLSFETPLASIPELYDLRDLDGNPLTPDDLPFTRALRGDTFYDYRLMRRKPDGSERFLSFTGAPAINEQGEVEGAVITLRDITANQKVQRAKDEFLAVAAHELRSPLAAVRSYADLLLRREQQREGDARDLHGLTILTQQVSHMLRLVDNLLDVSRLDAGQFDLQYQTVNLVTLAQQVIDQQRPSAGNRELLLETEAPELWISCDAVRIRQVLTNLLNNALKYSPAGSVVSVRVRSASLPANNAPAALISVSDQGPGIPASEQERVFQRYYRSPGRRGEGLGLGLYLSREIVQLHGGQIWIESREGQGSTFMVLLPSERPQG